jgi:DNA-binding MarR family transcriptional regulator
MPRGMLKSTPKSLRLMTVLAEKPAWSLPSAGWTSMPLNSTGKLTVLVMPLIVSSPVSSRSSSVPATPVDVNLIWGFFSAAKKSVLAHAYLRWIDANADHGLTFLRLRLIDRLNEEGPAMMRTLADELRLTPRHMTALVDALEQENLVARRPHPTDRRATVVELTASGCEAANAVLAPSMNAIAGLFDELTAEEMVELEALVGKLLTALRERGQRA